MGVFFAMILTLAAIGAVTYPLFKSKMLPASNGAEGSELEDLTSKRDSIYAAMKELDFDKAIGNLSEADYAELRERYKRRAIGILQEIDAVGKEPGNGAAAHGKARPHEEAIEQGVAAAPAPGASSSTAQGRVRTVRYCRACGSHVDSRDRFCGECGTEVTAANPRPE